MSPKLSKMIKRLDLLNRLMQHQDKFLNEIGPSGSNINIKKNYKKNNILACIFVVPRPMILCLSEGTLRTIIGGTFFRYYNLNTNFRHTSPQKKVEFFVSFYLLTNYCN